MANWVPHYNILSFTNCVFDTAYLSLVNCSLFSYSHYGNSFSFLKTILKGHKFFQETSQKQTLPN